MAAGNSVELRDENDKLRKENLRLSRKLSQMKNLYNNIVLMSKHFSSQQQGRGGVEGGEQMVLEVALPMLELILARWAKDKGRVKQEEVTSAMAGSSLRLFKVSIGVKRLHGEDDGQDLPERVSVPEIKLEPFLPRSVLECESCILRCPRSSRQVCNRSDRVSGEW